MKIRSISILFTKNSHRLVSDQFRVYMRFSDLYMVVNAGLLDLILISTNMYGRGCRYSDVQILFYNSSRNYQQYSLIVPLLYFISWLLHVSAVACHHQGAS
jgi:hypothetical protein